MLKYSTVELSEFQTNDEVLNVIRDWLTKNIEPTTQELFRQSPAVKYNWSHRKQLKMVDDLLFYVWEFPNYIHKPLLVIPRSLIEEILKLGHDLRRAGHLGQTNTLLSLRKTCMWFQMRKDAILFVKTCSI